MTLQSEAIAKPAASAASRSIPKWARWFVAVCLILTGLINLMSYFVLPSCDESNIVDTVKGIFKGKDVPLTSMTNIRLLSEADKDKTCAASVAYQGGEAQISYRIYWEGWDTIVRIADVQEGAGATASPAASGAERR